MILLPEWTTFVLGTFAVIFGCAASAASGLGGGGILIPVMLLLFEFSPNHAVALSNVTILGSAISNLISNAKRRHPIYRKNLLIDWDAVIMMEPPTMVGAIVGSLVHRVLPGWMLLWSLEILLLALSAHVIYKGINEWKRSSQYQELSGTPSGASTVQVRDLDGEIDRARVAYIRNRLIFVCIIFAVIVILNLVKCSNGRMFYYGINGMIVLWVFLSSIFSGLFLHSSWVKRQRIGIPRPVAVVSVGSIVERNVPIAPSWAPLPSSESEKNGVNPGNNTATAVKKNGDGDSTQNTSTRGADSEHKEEHGSVEEGGTCTCTELAPHTPLLGSVPGVSWSVNNVIFCPLISSFAGIFAGTYGIGGGFIKGPLLMHLGLHNEAAAATSSTMIFSTSLTATTSFFAFRQVLWAYTAYFFILGTYNVYAGLAAFKDPNDIKRFLSTAAGQYVQRYLLARKYRSATVALTMGLVMVVSALVMSLQTFIHVPIINEKAKPIGYAAFCGLTQ